MSKPAFCYTDFKLFLVFDYVNRLLFYLPVAGSKFLQVHPILGGSAWQSFGQHTFFRLGLCCGIGHTRRHYCVRKLRTPVHSGRNLRRKQPGVQQSFNLAWRHGVHDFICIELSVELCNYSSPRHLNPICNLQFSRPWVEFDVLMPASRGPHFDSCTLPHLMTARTNGLISPAAAVVQNA